MSEKSSKVKRGKAAAKAKAKTKAPENKTTETSKLLRQLDKSGLTTAAVAEKLNVNWYTVYRWSRGHHDPHPGTLARLRALLVAPTVPVDASTPS
jgi:DNA invertase Pin-like site-specific DNA recombinase